MNSKKILLLLLVLTAIGGCRKDQTNNPVLDGTYSGEFTITGSADQAPVKKVEMNLKSGQYSSLDGNSNITVGGGTFKINGQMLNFQETEYFPDNLSVVKTAILSGTYSYKVSGDSLFLSATKTDQRLLSYKLKKQ